jgi:hypothetical protein
MMYYVYNLSVCTVHMRLHLAQKKASEAAVSEVFFCS